MEAQPQKPAAIQEAAEVFINKQFAELPVELRRKIEAYLKENQDAKILTIKINKPDALSESRSTIYNAYVERSSMLSVFWALEHRGEIMEIRHDKLTVGDIMIFLEYSDWFKGRD